MNNTTRDRTKEGLDPDNPGLEVVPPPETPIPDDSAHVPGGAAGNRRTGARARTADGRREPFRQIALKQWRREPGPPVVCLREGNSIDR